HFDDVLGHVPGAGAFADSGSEGFGQVVRNALAVCRDDEQYHFHVAVDLAADDEAIFDLGDGFDLSVDFGGADSDAARVEGGVGTAVDDGAAVFGEFDEITVGPNAGEAVEVGVLVARVVRVLPEADRHGRQRLAADQFAPAVADRLTVIAVGHGVNAQESALDLATAHWQQRGGANETATDVGAAGDGAEQGVWCAVAVDPVVVFRQQGGAGGEDDAQMALIERFGGLEFRFAAAGDEAGAGAEMGDFFLHHRIPKEVQAGIAGGAVDGDYGGAGHQCRGLPVPHHPAAGGEVEEAVFRAHVAVEHEFLRVVDQQASGAMHDALGFAGGAGGIEDVDRMVRVHGRERRCLPCTKGQSLVPGGDQFALNRGFIWQLLDADHHFQGWQLCNQFREVVLAGKHLTAVAITVYYDQGRRFDLAEAVVDGTYAEVRRGGTPDGAQTGGRQHADQGFVAIGDHACDPVALDNALASQEGFQRAGVGFQLSVGLAQCRAGFAIGRHGFFISMVTIGEAQQIGRKVQFHAREPFRAGHFTVAKNPFGRYLTDQAAVVPDFLPE